MEEIDNSSLHTLILKDMDTSQPLTNARHERFAQALFRGLTADAAYREAGFKPNRGNAAALKANQSISARLVALQRQVASKAVAERQEVEARLTGIIRSDTVEPQVIVSASRVLGQWNGWEKGTEAENKLAESLGASLRRRAAR